MIVQNVSVFANHQGRWMKYLMDVKNPYYKDGTFFFCTVAAAFLGDPLGSQRKTIPLTSCGWRRFVPRRVSVSCAKLQQFQCYCGRMSWSATHKSPKFCNINISQHVTSAATHSCTTWISTVAPEVRWTSQKLRINFSMHKKHIGFRIDDFKLRIALCTAWEQDTCSLLPHFV